MRFGVFTVMLPGLAPEEAAAAIAAAGFDGVEWRVKVVDPGFAAEAPSFWRNNRCTLSPDAEAGRRGRAIAEAQGLAVPNVGAYVEVGDEAGFEAALAFAEGAGAPGMRLLTARWKAGASYEDLFRRTCAFWDWAVPRAAARGVRLLGETHHATIAPSVSLLMRLLSRFPPSEVGLLFDPGNLVWEGFEDYDLALQLAGGHLAYVHVKNTRYETGADGRQRPAWSPFGEGVLDLAEVFTALRRAGYDGWVTIEDFSTPAATHEQLAATRRMLADAWLSTARSAAA